MKLLKKVAMRLSSLPGVDKVKLVSGAPTPSAKTKAVKDKCTTQVLLDDSAVETLNVGVLFLVFPSFLSTMPWVNYACCVAVLQQPKKETSEDVFT